MKIHEAIIIIISHAITITPRMSGTNFLLEEHSSSWSHAKLSALNILLGEPSMMPSVVLVPVN